MHACAKKKKSFVDGMFLDMRSASKQQKALMKVMQIRLDELDKLNEQVLELQQVSVPIVLWQMYIIIQ